MGLKDTPYERFFVRRDDLAHAVRERLKRYPEPHASHYGVVPLAPPEDSIALGVAGAWHQAASGDCPPRSAGG
jgi:hypothetical protein